MARTGKPPPSRHAPDDPLLSVDDVAAWLGGQDPRWIRRNYRDLFPQVTFVGRRLYWRRSVIADYLDRVTVGWSSELAPPEDRDRAGQTQHRDQKQRQVVASDHRRVPIRMPSNRQP